MKWISLIFATVSMAALGWLVWQLTAAQERRAERKAAEALALEKDSMETSSESDDDPESQRRAGD